MLGIRRIGANRADYYLSDLALELPAGGRGAGRWAGAAALGMGLDQGAPVDPAQFRLLLAGRHPQNGRPLPLPAGRRVAGYDLCFSAPKSASVLFGLGGDEVAGVVLGAHHEAVDAAMRYLERHGLGAVRSRGDGGAREREVIATAGFAGVRFTHGVNRNLDPHLHSHVVVANAVQGVDGRWSACDGRGLDAHRRAAGSVYEADFRAALTASLGLRWDSVPGRTAEISGIPPGVLGEFSSRGADIRMHAHVFGARSARGRHVAWAATRPNKVTGTSYDELVVEWRRRADCVGLTNPALGLDAGRGRAQARTQAGAGSYDEHRFAGVISVTPHRGAHRRDVVEAFAASARDGVSGPSLERAADLWCPAPGGVVGVSEALSSRQSVVPGDHLLAALGPRPIDPDDHATWVGAARALDAYRAQWGIARAVEPLGDRAPSTMPPARLADHLRVVRQLDAARVSLGRRAPAEMELGLGR